MKHFFSIKLEDSSNLSTRDREIVEIIPNSMLAIILRLLTDSEPITFNKRDYDGNFRDVAVLADNMCFLFYGFKYVFKDSLDSITLSLDTERVDDLKRNLLKYFDKVTKNGLNSRIKATTEWKKLNDSFVSSLGNKILHNYPFSSLEYIPIVLYEYLVGNIYVHDINIRLCRDFDKDGNSRICEFEKRHIEILTDDFIKINAILDLNGYIKNGKAVNTTKNLNTVKRYNNVKTLELFLQLILLKIENGEEYITYDELHEVRIRPSRRMKEKSDNWKRNVQNRVSKIRQLFKEIGQFDNNLLQDGEKDWHPYEYKILATLEQIQVVLNKIS